MKKLNSMFLALATAATPFVTSAAFAHEGHHQSAEPQAIRVERNRLEQDFYGRHSAYHDELARRQAQANVELTTRQLAEFNARLSAEHTRWHEIESTRLSSAQAALDHRHPRDDYERDRAYDRLERERLAEMERHHRYEHERIAQLERELELRRAAERERGRRAEMRRVAELERERERAYRAAKVRRERARRYNEPYVHVRLTY